MPVCALFNGTCLRVERIRVSFANGSRAELANATLDKYGPTSFVTTAIMKPFKSPFLHGTPKESPIDLTASDQDDAQPPPYKKRRLLIHLVEESPPKGKAAAVSPAASAPRKPLLVVKNPVESKEPAAAFTDGQEFYYNVLWYACLLPIECQ